VSLSPNLDREPAVSVRITLSDEARSFEQAPGQTVLEAALSAGVDWPRSCRNGSCRSCLAQVEVGSVRYRIDWPGLTPEEKEWGCILPCVAEATSDLVMRRP
jgi:ferredoxin